MDELSVTRGHQNNNSKVNLKFTQNVKRVKWPKFEQSLMKILCPYLCVRKAEIC